MSLILFFLIMPFYYTVINILLICNQKGKMYYRRHEYSTTTLIVGGLAFVTLFLTISSGHPGASADTENIFFHFSSAEYFILIFILLLISIISLQLFDQPKIMSPLSAVLCVSGSFAGLTALIVTMVELFVTMLPENDIICNISLFYLWLYVINYFLCQARIIRDGITDYRCYFRNNDISWRSDFSCSIARILNNVSGWFSLSMFCLVPLIVILILFSVIVL